jgi:uncharacterized protein with HEPN domain
MVESVGLIEQYLRGGEFKQLETETLLQDAVLRRLILIGEAAGNVSATTRDRFPAVPWRLMADFRNFVVHEYHRIDWEVVWRVATERLPAVGPALVRVFETLDAEDQAQ